MLKSDAGCHHNRDGWWGLVPSIADHFSSEVLGDLPHHHRIGAFQHGQQAPPTPCTLYYVVGKWGGQRAGGNAFRTHMQNLGGEMQLA